MVVKNRFLVEHNVPNGSSLTVSELELISEQSQLVSQQLDRQVLLLHTTITNDRMVCLYEAQDEQSVHEFSRLCGLPIRWVSQVAAVIGPDDVCRTQ